MVWIKTTDPHAPYDEKDVDEKEAERLVKSGKYVFYNEKNKVFEELKITYGKKEKREKEILKDE